MVGQSERNRVLLVVFCEKDESVIRIVSARKTTRKERKEYEKGIRPTKNES